MKGEKGFFTRIFHLHRVFFECLRQQVGESGLHPRQGPILGILLHHEDISQAEVVRRMNVSAATVAVSITRLEKLGMVTRVRNESNQRANILALTPKGHKVALMMEQAMEEVGTTALQGVSNQERETVECCFQKMMENLQKKYQIKECKHKHAAHD